MPCKLRVNASVHQAVRLFFEIFGFSAPQQRLCFLPTLTTRNSAGNVNLRQRLPGMLLQLCLFCVGALVYACFDEALHGEKTCSNSTLYSAAISSCARDSPAVQSRVDPKSS